MYSCLCACGLFGIFFVTSSFIHLPSEFLPYIGIIFFVVNPALQTGQLGFSSNHYFNGKVSIYIH